MGIKSTVFIKRTLYPLYTHKQGAQSDVFIHSTQRSGSTLLFDVIASQPKMKAIGEPFQERKQPVFGRYLQETRSRYVTFNQGLEGGVRHYIDDLLSGQFVGGFERTYNPRSVRHHRYSNRNTVKLLRTLECTGWFASNYPTDNHLVLIRHPVSTVLSRVRNQWHPPIEDFLSQHTWFSGFSPEQRGLARSLAGGSPFSRHLIVWLFEHAFLSQAHQELRRRGVHLLAYEHVVTEPLKAATWLVETLDLPRLDMAIDSIQAPSRSTRHSTSETTNAIREGDSGELLGGWRSQVSSQELEPLEMALEPFGIGFYRTNQTLPQGFLIPPPWASYSR